MKSAESIMEAFCRRSKAVHPIINAVVDERFEAALQEAREVDQWLDACTQEERDEISRTQPLLGVPFTAKESVMVKGLSNTVGLVSRRGMKATRDAEVVSRLREAGAIPVAVTNVPEMVMWVESYNLLYGRTANPYDVSRTPGGSSGGEAALLTSCGTPLCVGTDVGGSIRIPSFFCGTFGHKPTSGWVSLDGTRPFPYVNKSRTISVAGPLCRSVEDLVVFLECVARPATGLADKVADTDVGALKIWWVDGIESPSCRSTDQPLREALHTACRHLHQSFGATTCQTTANLVVELLRWMCGRGRHTLPLLMYALLTKLPRTFDHLSWKKVQTYFLDTLDQNGVLLLPVWPQVAPFHGEPLFSFDAGLTGIFNATEMPSTAVPLGLTKDGLPLGLQVVTTPGNDHLSLAVAAALEEKFGGWVSPSPVTV